MENTHKECSEIFSKHKKTISILFVLIMLGVTTFLFAKTLVELKELKFVGQGVEFRNTITVSGQGELTVVPDTVEFSFAVIKEAGEVEDAQEQVTKIMNGLLLYLGEFGVKEEDTKTTNYNISPRYDFSRQITPFPPQPGKRELIGYEVAHFITIKVRSLDLVGSIIAELGKRGATNLSQIRFTVEDEEVVKAEARKMAIEDAQEKAKILSKDLKVRIVKVVSFNESGRSPFQRTFGTTALLESLDGGFIPEIPVGENTITSNVSITYSIE